MDDERYDLELENKVKVGYTKLGVEEEAEIQSAVRILLQGLGEDINREGIQKTPLRVAKALRHATKGYKQNAKDIVEGALFPEAGLVDNNTVGRAGGAGGLVVVRDLDLFSYCECCLLPFQVKCHIGYVPCGERVVGLSKLSRVADVYAKRLQDPQRLADEVCLALHHSIKPAGVAVIFQCVHMHVPALKSMFLDRSPQGCIKVLVSSGSGIFLDEDGNTWGEFFGLLGFRSSIADEIQKKNSTHQWCPSQASPISKVIDPSMVSAVTSILRSLGEDPSRKELLRTPARFLKWLMYYQNCNTETELNAILGNSRGPQKSNGNVKVNKRIHSELSLPFWSQCEHHLLPFHGVVHIGYFSAGEDPVEKSILQSIVLFYGFKLQVQERLTKQVAETVAPLVGGDVIVVAEASHMCMIARGIEKLGSSTATVAVLGHFSTDAKLRASFLESLPSNVNGFL
ncbi:GTP cyclohydrolase 1 [Beta vulgaris subsp. vulgaris]|uniref:GTP cyclohydrolase 1 n=1 Tax=Beta vulgaris subsp. vulgaris TaxID=3555 RepID=UPI0020367BEA|nr:GTP cyclohydrolase 1 [Beta vulgaris subsp. vulgaris]